MRTYRFLPCVGFSLLLLLGGGRAVAPAWAAGDDPPSASPAALVDDDDTVLQLAEPDFRLINLPTTLRLPAGKGNFDLTHRFGGNFRRGSFTDQASRFFGIDDGASVGFEYRMGVLRHVEAVVYRTVIDRTIQLYGKVDAIHQRPGRPLSLSALVSVEGADNFQERYAPAFGLSVSRVLSNRLAAYVVPIWVHNTAAVLGVDDDTSFVGVGVRVLVHGTTYVAVEGSPRVAGFSPGVTQYGIAIEKRAGGHMFQLNVTNGSATTLAQVARGGQPGNLALGFNLARKFF